MPAPHFIVHDRTDNVGVIVAEDGVKKGQSLTGWVMENDSTVQIKAVDDIPLGHKIAMRDLKKGETALKYGNDIGKMVAPAGKGRHVHVHNLKTKRW